MAPRTPALLLAATLALTLLPAWADVVVIVSPHNPIASLTVEQAGDIFLGRLATFPGGSEAVPIDQSEGMPARNAFYQKSIGKAPHQMKAYWARMIFTGRGQPPVESGDDAAIKRLVANNPNVIGYIDKGALDGTVKPVLTLH